MSLVPATAAEVDASAEFELTRVTTSGLRLYVRALERGVANRIIIGSRDFKFLGGNGDNQFLLVAVRDGQILRGEPKPYGDLERADVMEILNLLTGRMGKKDPNAN